VVSGGLGGSELAGMSELELRDVLQLPRAEAESLHRLLLTAGDTGGVDGAQRHSKTISEQLDERFPLFMESVCERCAYSGYECGCEQGEDNPAFEVLRDYGRQYHAWHELARGGGDVDGDEAPKWIVIDVTMGLGNNLLAYVNGLLLALCLGRALVLNTHDPYPLEPVFNFMLESDITRSPRGEPPPAKRHLFLDQRSGTQQGSRWIHVCDRLPRSSCPKACVPGRMRSDLILACCRQTSPK